MSAGEEMSAGDDARRAGHSAPTPGARWSAPGAGRTRRLERTSEYRTLYIVAPTALHVHYRMSMYRDYGAEAADVWCGFRRDTYLCS